MSGKSNFRARFGAALLCCTAAALSPTPAAAQTYVGTSAEEPSDALARHVRVLAANPREFTALIGAGKAALALGDSQAAAGFFGRAEEVWPKNSQPQIGMGAALAHEGDPSAALQYFARAVQLGASPAMVGLERGLAYDLLGYHQQAQSDYRSALAGEDRDEARRRLALSLAITGKKDEALAMLAPLMAKGDAAGARSRAFVLALTGDRAGARAAIEAAMPGTSARMDYFFHKLPALASQQKAAAVHLGLFPDSDQLASAGPPTPVPSYSSPGSAGASGDRLSSVDQLLRQGAPSQAQRPLASPPARTTQVASAARRTTRPAAARPEAPDGQVYSTRRVWLQLASGSSLGDLPDQFKRIKSRNRDLFDGISGYVAEEAGKARLLIGPFRSSTDAQIFAEDLETVRVDAFSWSNRPGQVIVKVAE